MKTKEFKEKLETFIDSNTGKYKLRIIDKENDISSLIPIFVVDDRVDFAKKKGLYDVDLLDLPHLAIGYSESNKLSDFKEYDRDFLVDLEQMLDLLLHEDKDIYIYHMTEFNEWASEGVYDFKYIKEVKFNNKDKMIDLIVGNTFYKSITIRCTM